METEDLDLDEGPDLLPGTPEWRLQCCLNHAYRTLAIAQRRRDRRIAQRNDWRTSHGPVGIELVVELGVA